MIPDGWQQVRLGDLFESSREKGRPGLPTMSVTLSDGLVLREILERKTETNLRPEEHIRLRDGYIAYNMMRMWQGASGLAGCDALVSPAYVVLKPNSEVDPLFASYFFKASRTIYLFWAYSYGLTRDRLRLYFPDFSIIPVVFPPINEQHKIGSTLSTWDQAIEITEELIDKSRAQKKALMQQLLTGKKRLPGFSDDWSESVLKNIATILVSPVNKKSIAGEQSVRLCNYTDVYYNSRITNDLDLMVATASNSEVKRFTLKKNDLVITKDSETPGDIAVPALVSEELDNVVCGYHLAIIRPNTKAVVGAFLNHLFSQPKVRHYFSTRANGATRFGLTIDGIKEASFMLPRIEEQQKIANILDVCDIEIRSLNTVTQQLTIEKRALMQQLLTGKRRVKVTE